MDFFAVDDDGHGGARSSNSKDNNSLPDESPGMEMCRGGGGGAIGRADFPMGSMKPAGGKGKCVEGPGRGERERRRPCAAAFALS
jgi:hypothetical protein